MWPSTCSTCASPCSAPARCPTGLTTTPTCTGLCWHRAHFIISDITQLIFECWCTWTLKQFAGLCGSATTLKQVTGEVNFDYLIIMVPIKSWGFLCSKWRVSYWSWWVGSRNNEQKQQVLGFKGRKTSLSQFCCAWACVATVGSECRCWSLSTPERAYNERMSIRTGLWIRKISWPSLMSHVFFKIMWTSRWRPSTGIHYESRI